LAIAGLFQHLVQGAYALTFLQEEGHGLVEAGCSLFGSVAEAGDIELRAIGDYLLVFLKELAGKLDILEHGFGSLNLSGENDSTY
jgi:hypothetical protein